jgi:hypothetical protein
MESAPAYTRNYTCTYYGITPSHELVAPDGVPNSRLEANIQSMQIDGSDVRFFEVDSGMFTALDVAEDIDWAFTALSISYPQTLLVVIARGEHDFDMEQCYYYQGRMQSTKLSPVWCQGPNWDLLDPAEDDFLLT